MKRILKREYTAEFREQAVAMVKQRTIVPEVAAELALIEQTLRNWLKAAEEGRLNEKATKVTEGADGALTLALAPHSEAEQGRAAAAAPSWERMLKQLPPDSPMIAEVKQLADDARRLAAAVPQ